MKTNGLPYLIILPALWLDMASKNAASNIFGGVKTLVPGVLSIRLVHNNAMMFTLGINPQGHSSQWLLWALILSAFGALVALAVTTRGKKPMRHFGIACMIGGALGNGVDRLLHGHVTDFIHLRFMPIMNVADIFFLVGAATVIYETLRTQPKH